MNLDEIKEILQILQEKEITEFELEQDGVKLRVVKAASTNHGAPAPAVFADLPVPAASSAVVEAAAVGPVAAPEPEGDHAVVKSPIVGTFYRAAEANALPFVSVGDHVRIGQVLCIVEAMKLMNEIEAEVAGEVLAIHRENGQPVQYGDPLFTIRPTA